MKQTNEESNEKWFRVSLRLWGDDLPVDEVGNLLSLEAFSIGRKGKHIDDNPKRALYKTNVWVWSSFEESHVPFDLQIGDLLEVLERRQNELKQLLSLPNVDAELFLGFSSVNGQGGANFSNAMLRRIALLGLSVDLDLYPPSE